LERIQRETNRKKPKTGELISEESEEIYQRSQYMPGNNKKPNKRRRDVIFKTILRECRRFLQIQLSELTGFVTSRKVRHDDYMYLCMEKFNKEILQKQGTFMENFYLACLLYPQDLTRSMDQFLSGSSSKINDVKTKKLEYIKIAENIHDTLYKYTHDKLDFFVQKHELAYLFCYYHENGAVNERNNPNFEDEYEFIRQKCMNTLNSL
jgi:hypothetical protein